MIAISAMQLESSEEMQQLVGCFGVQEFSLDFSRWIIFATLQHKKSQQEIFSINFIIYTSRCNLNAYTKSGIIPIDTTVF